MVLLVCVIGRCQWGHQSPVTGHVRSMIRSKFDKRVTLGHRTHLSVNYQANKAMIGSRSRFRAPLVEVSLVAKEMQLLTRFFGCLYVFQVCRSDPRSDLSIDKFHRIVVVGTWYDRARDTTRSQYRPDVRVSTQRTGSTTMHTISWLQSNCKDYGQSFRRL
jgi:hypothetical protein